MKSALLVIDVQNSARKKGDCAGDFAICPGFKPGPRHF
jgi:hypothetical protein